MTRARTAVPLLLGIAVIAVGAAVLMSRSGGDPYTVRVELGDAAGLFKNSQVKIGGVPGGTIASLELTRGDRALAILELDEGAAPIGKGASARVRPVNLLGEKYLELNPGDVERPQPSGSTIPAERTSAAVELDDVLNTLDPDTRGRLRILINEAGIALRGRGADFNALLEELPPALDELRTLVAEVGADTQRLERLIDQGDRVVASASGGRDDLGRLVESAQRALAVTAERRRELGLTIANAPSALRQLESTLTRLGAASDSLAPAAGSLREAAPPLAAALRAVPGFADAASGTLQAAREAAPALDRLARSATPAVGRLRPTAELLASVGGELGPLTTALDRDGGIDGLLSTVHHWSRVVRRSDAGGHMFSADVTFNEETITHLLDNWAAEAQPRRSRARRERRRSESAPSPRGGGPRERRPAPGVTDRLPRLPGALRQPLEQLPELQRQLESQGGRDGGGRPAPSSDALGLFDYLFGQ